MTFPGEAVTRLAQFTLRNLHSYRTQRSCSIIINKCLNILTPKNKFTVSSSNKFINFGITLHQIRAMSALSPLDPSSFSRPELAKINHISLSLNVDFDKKILSGEATLNVDVLDDVQEVILDARDLNIESIESENGDKLEYKIGEEVPNFGSKLTVSLGKQVAQGDKHNEDDDKTKTDKVLFPSNPQTDDMLLRFNGYCYQYYPGTYCRSYTDNHSQTNEIICCKCKRGKQDGCCRAGIKLKIKYSTVPTASALQWLEPEQTSGKQYPYLFSQCQPIHARSIVPCQDTPAVKFTYDAQVTAPPHFTVLMSALRSEPVANVTRFNQPMPLPSYLVAIAVGVLEFRSLGPRSKVWSESAEIERSAWEFAETEQYLRAAERLCGAYVWDTYDLLVLPPSFPYGGMENPCLTFVTPTLLAGDRSLADVIVHEIMHSWTGNLVTNRNFEHFWLNEGFTVFLERKVAASLIQDPVEAKKSRDFHSILGLQELNETIVDTLGPNNPLTQLVVNLQNVHPDDSFSRVPYEKGSLFLRYLEDLVGGAEVFDEFLRSYLTKYSKKSLDTDDFKTYLLEYYKDNEALKTVDWDTWLYKSGMPPVIPDYDTSMTKAVTSLVDQISANPKFSYKDIQSFTPHQMINLLQTLIDREPLTLEALRSLGEEYKITSSKNAEIQYRWVRLCIRSKDQDKLQDAFNFVNSQGRMKYVRPVYRDLYAWEDIRQQAIDNFLANEKYMMHVSAYTLRKDLHLS